MLGQFFYVVGHEMGHAMFDFLNVPLFGRPEDAADYFAAYVMLLFGKQDARRLIVGAAYTYRNAIQNPKVTSRLVAFSSVHGAPAQRFFNLMCLAFGADRDTFGDLVKIGYLPEARSRGCRVEFGELNFAFRQLIQPHVDQELAKAVLQQSWLPAADARPDPPLRRRRSDISGELTKLPVWTASGRCGGIVPDMIVTCAQARWCYPSGST